MMTWIPLMATKQGRWVIRIVVFLIAAVAQYAYVAYAEKRAYNNGYLVAKAEYVESVRTQSEKLSAQLNDTFKQHQELLNKQKVEHEKVMQIAEAYRNLGACHTDDGIRLLNEQIRKRGTRSESTTKP